MEMERMECDKVDGNGIDKNQINIKMRAPTKILHFCDGTMEVFDDELTVEKKEVSKDEADTTVDESKMSWGEWFKYKASNAGHSFINGCDYVGEYLAYTLGITSPKYEYEIEQYKEMEAEKERELAKEKDARTWLGNQENGDSPQTEAPKY